jgi:DNA-binding MarR family transcriptional regulator
MTIAPEKSLFHLLHRALQISDERLALNLDDLDLTHRQIVVLSIIERNGGCNQIQIVEASGVDRATLSGIVNRLLKKGLIVRQRNRKDTRAYTLSLTGAGRRQLEAASQSIARLESQILAAMSPRMRLRLVRSLDVLIAGQAADSLT